MGICKNKTVYQCDICKELKWKQDGLLILKGKEFWQLWHEEGWDRSPKVICADCQKVIKKLAKEEKVVNI